jgi:transcriptional regulator with XRE-family HTH domain
VRPVEQWTGAEAKVLRKAMRLTVRAFAEHLGLAARTVAKWEAGGAGIVPRPDTQAILDTALARAGEAAQVRFAALRRVAPLVGANDLGALQPLEWHDLPGGHDEDDGPSGTEPEGDEDVRRREFMGRLAAASLSLALPERPMPRRVDAAGVRELAHRTARLRALDEHMGGADTYPLYLREFTTTAELAHQARYSEATGQQLLGVLAEQAQQAGWAAFDAGWHTTSARLYETSVAAAREADDAALHGNALAFLAYQQTSQTRSGVDLAERSCRIAGDAAHPTSRALLHERLAWAYAVDGRAADAERALDSARRLLERPASQRIPGWAAWVDPTEISIMQGRCWTELNQPLRAVGVLERALAVYEDRNTRDKALYLTWLAYAYLDGDEIEQAALTTGRAMSLGAGVASIRPAQRVAPLLRRLQPHRHQPTVSGVLDRAGELGYSLAPAGSWPTERATHSK